MENNTVAIDIETYNRLRDFKKEIEAGKVGMQSSNAFGYTPPNYYRFVSESDALKILTERFNSEMNSKEDYIQQLRTKVTEMESTTEIDNVKSMNIFQLIKWRFTK